MSKTADLPEELASLIKGATGPFHYNGDTVLVYRGQADKVELVTWMPGFPAADTFRRVGGDLWYLRLFLPGTARIEYRLRISAGRVAAEIDDPLNPHTTSNPFGENSVVAGPAYQPPWFAGSGFVGSLNEIRVTSTRLGGRRHHHVYLPGGQTIKEASAVLLVHDGSDFLAHGGLGVALDRLVENGIIPPLVAILLDPWDRISEYSGSPIHSGHVVEEIIPHLSRRLRLRVPRQRTVALGSSLGAVASLALAYHYPAVVGAVASLSGSFAHRTDQFWPPAVFLPVIEFLEQLDAEVLEDSAIYQSVGRYEGLVDFNRRLRPLLSAGGARLRSVETWTGHDWAAWRDRLEDALAFLLPRPDAK